MWYAIKFNLWRGESHLLSQWIVIFNTNFFFSTRICLHYSQCKFVYKILMKPLWCVDMGNRVWISMLDMSHVNSPWQTKHHRHHDSHPMAMCLFRGIFFVRFASFHSVFLENYHTLLQMKKDQVNLSLLWLKLPISPFNNSVGVSSERNEAIFIPPPDFA